MVNPSPTLAASSCLPLDDIVLVLQEDPRQAIGIHDYVLECSVLSTGGGAVLEDLGGSM